LSVEPSLTQEKSTMPLIVVTSVRNQDRARVVLPVELHGRLVAADLSPSRRMSMGVEFNSP
jgi:hypothetical protein